MSLFHVYTQWFEVIFPGETRFTICAHEESGFDRVRVSVYIAVPTIGVVLILANFKNRTV